MKKVKMILWQNMFQTPPKEVLQLELLLQIGGIRYFLLENNFKVYYVQNIHYSCMCIAMEQFNFIEWIFFHVVFV